MRGQRRRLRRRARERASSKREVGAEPQVPPPVPARTARIGEVGARRVGAEKDLVRAALRERYVEPETAGEASAVADAIADAEGSSEFVLGDRGPRLLVLVNEREASVRTDPP